MRRQGLWTLKALTLLSVVACTTFSAKEINLVEIASYDQNIRVFTEEEPTFDYKIVCEGKVHTNGRANSPKTLSGYREEAAKVAQDCGAPMAMVKSVTGVGNRLTVEIIGIEQTSDKAKLFEKVRKNRGFLGHLTEAALNGDTNRMESLLKGSGVGKNRKKRANFDDRILDGVATLVAKQGSHCSVPAMNFLTKKYQARIGDYDVKNPNSWSTSHEMRQLMSCPAAPLKLSFAQSEKKNEYAAAIYKTVDTALEGGWKHSEAKQNYLSFQRIYPDLQKAATEACQSDKTSELCKLKTPLKKAYKAVSKTI